MDPQAVEKYNEGVKLYKTGRYLEALAAFEEAVEIEPGYAWAHNGRGGVLHDLKHHEEALAAYDEAIRIQPEYATSHYNKGNVLYALMCNGQYLI